MPDVKNAELIDGIVYLQYRVSAIHGMAHANLGALLCIYSKNDSNLLTASNSTVRIDDRNDAQPDLLMMRRLGGRATIDEDDFVSGAPDLIAEIAASSVSYDLHQKKRAYLNAGVLEYLVWLTEENRIVWWRLENGDYVEIPPAADGSLESVEFPGLVIDASAVIAGDFAKALARIK